MSTTEITLTAADEAFIERANASGAVPAVFVHGLWLHASSWEQWIERFEADGFVAYAPGWPGDGATVEESRRHPERIAGHGVERVTARYRAIIRRLEHAPLLVGHSFGGLVVQKLLGEGLGRAAVAFDPAQMKGVVKLPLDQLLGVLPILANPLQFRGANSHSAASFARRFANTASRAESDALFERYAIPAPGRPLFEAGLANLLPVGPTTVDVDAARGPLLIVGGGKDRTVPAATTREIAKRYAKNLASTTEYVEFADRGHSLVLDAGWSELADYALGWLAFHGVTASAATTGADAA